MDGHRSPLFPTGGKCTYPPHDRDWQKNGPRKKLMKSSIHNVLFIYPWHALLITALSEHVAPSWVVRQNFDPRQSSHYLPVAHEIPGVLISMTSFGCSGWGPSLSIATPGLTPSIASAILWLMNDKRLFWTREGVNVSSIDFWGSLLG